jgi:hypothetical protein
LVLKPLDGSHAAKETENIDADRFYKPFTATGEIFRAIPGLKEVHADVMRADVTKTFNFYKK